MIVLPYPTWHRGMYGLARDLYGAGNLRTAGHDHARRALLDAASACTDPAWAQWLTMYAHSPGARASLPSYPANPYLRAGEQGAREEMFLEPQARAFLQDASVAAVHAAASETTDTDLSSWLLGFLP